MPKIDERAAGLTLFETQVPADNETETFLGTDETGRYIVLATVKHTEPGPVARVTLHDIERGVTEPTLAMTIVRLTVIGVHVAMHQDRATPVLIMVDARLGETHFILWCAVTAAAPRDKISAKLLLTLGKPAGKGNTLGTANIGRLEDTRVLPTVAQDGTGMVIKTTVHYDADRRHWKGSPVRWSGTLVSGYGLNTPARFTLLDHAADSGEPCYLDPCTASHAVVRNHFYYPPEGILALKSYPSFEDAVERQNETSTTRFPMPASYQRRPRGSQEWMHPALPGTMVVLHTTTNGGAWAFRMSRDSGASWRDLNIARVTADSMSFKTGVMLRDGTLAIVFSKIDRSRALERQSSPGAAIDGTSPQMRIDRVVLYVTGGWRPKAALHRASHETSAPPCVLF